MPENPNRPSRLATPTGSTPRIAVIGCGAIAELYYLPSLVRHPSVLEKLILVDRDQARAQKLATEFNVKNYLVDYRETLEGVDGVIIAVPTHLHYPISMEFLSRGVHVLCEKPLAESADEARAMIEEAHKTGAALSANYLWRLVATSLKVKELLTDKTLGEPLSIDYLVGEEFRWPTVSGFYFNSKVSRRGVLLDRGAHVLDLICWWLGDKPRITSSQNDSFGGREAVAHIQFEHRRCIGNVKLSSLGKFPCRFMVKCEAGAVKGDVYDYHSVLLTTETGLEKRVKLKSEAKFYFDFGHQMVTNFIQVIGEGKKPLVSGSDVLDSAELIDECYEAASRFDMPWYEMQEVKDGS